MEKKPVIKLYLTPSDRAIELAGWLLLIILWIFAVFAWFHLPDTIPVHYNAAGNVNGYGNKRTVFILPFIATAVFLLLTFLNNYPHIFSYLSRITEDNAVYQYTMATRMLRLLKLNVVVIFFCIDILTFFTATGRADGLGVWFLPVMLGLMLFPTGYFIVRSLKAK